MHDQSKDSWAGNRDSDKRKTTVCSWSKIKTIIDSQILTSSKTSPDRLVYARKSGSAIRGYVLTTLVRKEFQTFRIISCNNTLQRLES